FLFLHPRARSFYSEWDTVAHDLVAALRGEAGRNPYDRDLADLVGQLSVRSDEFRVLWAGHDVRYHRSGTKRFCHPLVGDLILAYESLQLPADPGLTLVTYSAEPGSSTERALGELADWVATRRRLTAVGADVRAEADRS
ncbi:MAG: transcriptional regulator, partial [Candidatus Limnocylindria bacterium]